ncbi:GTPase HflX [Clostridium fermenticellae]|uniref:GTPase HflX n=1 Tax=Clostridium fermenticellae TaxID=2068654 RepID=A0A386H289_9CLOT|nr:GTPase HflX [Clostridium fermenticellae]AYD39821.1 GTPase HflX [Clostridium fermenticellae]
MIYGNTDGIRNSILGKLDEIYEIKMPKDSICSNDLIDMLSEITTHLNREISVAINRKGNVISVAVGDSSTVEMPEVYIKQKKLSGIRIIHTHPNGNCNLSAIDLSALLKLKLDCIAALGVNESECKGIMIGFCSIQDGLLNAKITRPLNIQDGLNYNILKSIKDIEELMKDNDIVYDDSERAILVGIESQESIDELAELAEACNVKVVYKVFQKKAVIDNVFYVGKGKVNEIALLRQSQNSNIIIFDDELSASQVRNLEESIGAKVIDRTTLILEIFARRAKSREAKIQVELAQLKYRLPRLSGLGIILSRTGGGIGTRGPGEKKLEVDKRHIKEKIYDLNRELKKIKQVRSTQRNKRNELLKISLVGYTNAGKSTLRNKLCDVASANEGIQKNKVFEADMLFATLDTTTRAIALPDMRMAAVTDTVGFIRKLPHDLVEAFKSTLEEVIYSDLLLHVVDCSSEYAYEQINVVNGIFKELGVEDKPALLVLNKKDKASSEKINSILDNNKDIASVCISAKTGENIALLLKQILKTLPSKLRSVEYLIPYSEQSVVAFLHRNSKIKSEEYVENGTHIRVVVDDEIYNKCQKYLLSNIK